MLVKDLMNTNVVSITPEESAETAARLLMRHNLGALPVTTADGHVRGILTDRDIVLRCVAAEEGPKETAVKTIMTRGVLSVGPEEDIREATRLMAAEQVRRLPVVKDGYLLGMLSLGDLAKCQKYDMEVSKALSEISENVRRPF